MYIQGTDLFERSDGLSGDFIERLFEDREGDIWVATLDGLDRFRDLAVPTISVTQGLSNATVESVLAARDGSVWLGALDGLNRWDNGRVTVYHKGTGLPDDAIESIFHDFRDRIWVATRRGVAFLENGRFTPVSSVPSGVQFQHLVRSSATYNIRGMTARKNLRAVNSYSRLALSVPAQHDQRDPEQVR